MVVGGVCGVFFFIWRCLGLFLTPMGGSDGEFGVSVPSGDVLEMFWRNLGLFHTPVGVPEGGFGVLVASGDVLERFGPVSHPNGWS